MPYRYRGLALWLLSSFSGMFMLNFLICDMFRGSSRISSVQVHIIQDMNIAAYYLIAILQLPACPPGGCIISFAGSHVQCEPCKQACFKERPYRPWIMDYLWYYNVCATLCPSQVHAFQHQFASAIFGSCILATYRGCLMTSSSCTGSKLRLNIWVLPWTGCSSDVLMVPAFKLSSTKCLEMLCHKLSGMQMLGTWRHACAALQEFLAWLITCGIVEVNLLIAPLIEVNPAFLVPAQVRPAMLLKDDWHALTLAFGKPLAMRSS